MSDVQDVSPSTAAKSETMPKITFIEHDGTVHTVDAEIGSTVMETAQRNNVTSIVADAAAPAPAQPAWCTSTRNGFRRSERPRPRKRTCSTLPSR